MAPNVTAIARGYSFEPVAGQDDQYSAEETTTMFVRGAHTAWCALEHWSFELLGGLLRESGGLRLASRGRATKTNEARYNKTVKLCPKGQLDPATAL